MECITGPGLEYVTVTWLTVSQQRHLVSLVSVPLNTSSTHVLLSWPAQASGASVCVGGRGSGGADQ